MSKRQKDAHQQKMSARRRYFPLLTLEQIEAREGNIAVTQELIEDALTELGNPNSPHPEGTLGMRGAHLTITLYMLLKLRNELASDIDLINRRSDIVTTGAGLVDLTGRPLDQEPEA